MILILTLAKLHKRVSLFKTTTNTFIIDCEYMRDQYKSTYTSFDDALSFVATFWQCEVNSIVDLI